MVYDEFCVFQDGFEACVHVRNWEIWADVGKRDRLDRTRWMWLKT